MTSWSSSSCLASPSGVLRALATVVTGDQFVLSAPMDWLNPPLFGRGAPQHHVFRTALGNWDERLDNVYPQASSQWDAFAHWSLDDDAVSAPHEGDCINAIAQRGIVGRFVLADVARHVPEVADPPAWNTDLDISVDMLERTFEVQRVSPEPDDILFVRTGWESGYKAAGPAVRAALGSAAHVHAIGLETSPDMSGYLADLGLAAIAADNPALERLPNPLPKSDWLHTTLLSTLRIPVGELWWLDALAAACASDGRYVGALVSVPWSLVGGVGSPANAMALR